MTAPKISIRPTRTSRLAGTDFSNLAFGRVFSDHMYEVDYVDGAWQTPVIREFAPITMLPSNMAIHYGQSIFEGMKATLHTDGRPMLFRPEQHAQRLNRSAARMAMPAFPEDMFLEAINALVDLDRAWIPPTEGSALYLRPFMFATDHTIGVRPSSNYKFMIITSPVGPYYSKPVNLLAETTYIRAAQGGIGEAKAAGNYAAALLPTALAQAKGFDQILWLDAQELKYVQEVGTMNILFVIDGTVLTPDTSGTILPGITRDTALILLREAGYKVETRPISIDELVEAHRAGKLTEVFGAGTAAVVSPVASISYKDYTIMVPTDVMPVGNWIKDQMNGLRSGRIADTHQWLSATRSAEVASEVVA